MSMRAKGMGMIRYGIRFPLEASIDSLKEKKGAAKVARTEDDLSFVTVIGGSLGLVLLMAFALGVGANAQWKWLPVIWIFFIGFVCGLGLLSAALDVYVRDLRYVVESANVVLFWLVPIWYGFEQIAPEFRTLYGYNPVAAMVLAMRRVMLDAQPPPASLLWNLAFSSAFMLVIGAGSFRLLKRRFYEYL